MQDYVIVSVSWTAVFRVFFAAGTFLGGIGGIALGLIMDSSIGFFGGAFLGLAAGLFSGLMAAAYTAIFNLLAPYVGGITVSVATKPAEPECAPAAQEENVPDPNG